MTCSIRCDSQRGKRKCRGRGVKRRVKEQDAAGCGGTAGNDEDFEERVEDRERNSEQQVVAEAGESATCSTVCNINCTVILKQNEVT